jgi:hypothetical protein
VVAIGLIRRRSSGLCGRQRVDAEVLSEQRVVELLILMRKEVVELLILTCQEAETSLASCTTPSVKHEPASSPYSGEFTARSRASMASPGIPSRTCLPS